MKPNTLDPFMITDAREACRVASARQLGSEEALREAARDLAEKERAYRVALAQTITRLHADGVAWSSTADLARGDARCADLKFHRDVAAGVKEAAEQAAYRHGADRRDLGRFVDWSARIDVRSGGEQEQPSPGYYLGPVAA